MKLPIQLFSYISHISDALEPQLLASGDLGLLQGILLPMWKVLLDSTIYIPYYSFQ